MHEDYENMSTEMRAKKWSPGHLYILDYGDGEMFKIGITTDNPSVRASQVSRNVGSLVPNPSHVKLVVSVEMTSNPYYLEQLLHMSYVDEHEVGEWFRLSIDSLADLVGKIMPFGDLEYYDRWYDLFDDDYIGYVINGVYPSDLRYRKGLSQHHFGNGWALIPHKGGGQAAIKVKATFDELAKTYPHTFGDISLRIV